MRGPGIARDDGGRLRTPGLRALERCSMPRPSTSDRRRSIPNPARARKSDREVRSPGLDRTMKTRCACRPNDHAFSGGAQAPSAATRGSTAPAASSGNQHLKERALGHSHDDPEAPIAAVYRKPLLYEANCPLTARAPVRWFAWKPGSFRDGDWDGVPRVVPAEPERAPNRADFVRGQLSRAHIGRIGKLGGFLGMPSVARPDCHDGGEKPSADEQGPPHTERPPEHRHRSLVCPTFCRSAVNAERSRDRTTAARSRGRQPAASRHGPRSSESRRRSAAATACWAAPTTSAASSC